MLVRSRAPLRISFAGGGTDIEPYLSERGGVVLSTTINHYVYGSLQPDNCQEIRLQSLDYDTIVKYHRHDSPPRQTPLALVQAVVNRLNIPPEGFSLLLRSDAPPGSGLGSSSAMVVMILGLFRQWLGLLLSDQALAELAYEIERHDMRIIGGKQDQFAAAFGGFNFIEFTRDGTFVTPLRLGPATLNELECNLLLCFTGSTHPEGEILKDQVAAYDRREAISYTSLDQLKEITIAMKRALLGGKVMNFGQLLHEAWLTKRKLARGITTDRIDRLYGIARNKGAFGGKILGAGGGGYLLIFCPFDRRHKVAAALEEAGGRIVPFDFVSHGLQTWRVL
ncbi:MAG: GHMP kinase [Bacteroidota bacterium]